MKKIFTTINQFTSNILKPKTTLLIDNDSTDGKYDTNSLIPKLLMLTPQTKNNPSRFPQIQSNKSRSLSQNILKAPQQYMWPLSPDFFLNPFFSCFITLYICPLASLHFPVCFPLLSLLTGMLIAFGLNLISFLIQLVSAFRKLFSALIDLFPFPVSLSSAPTMKTMKVGGEGFLLLLTLLFQPVLLFCHSFLSPCIFLK